MSCCGPSCRTPSSLRSAMSPARTNSPTSVSFEPVYAHFGVPMPLMYPRSTATLAGFGGHAVPGAAQRGVRVASGPGRSRAEPAAGGQPAADGGPGVPASRTRAAGGHAGADYRRAAGRPDARGSRSLGARTRGARPARDCTPRSSMRPSAATTRCAASSREPARRPFPGATPRNDRSVSCTSSIDTDQRWWTACLPSCHSTSGSTGC